uniref:Uncharacterized protein n=1 Tax=Parascaris univalens TaxID=6257 RepID=A0A915BA70_PARUN
KQDCGNWARNLNLAHICKVFLLNILAYNHCDEMITFILNIHCLVALDACMVGFLKLCLFQGNTGESEAFS